MKNLEHQLKDFADYLTVYRGLGQITVSGYVKLIQSLFRKLQTVEITHRQIQDFMADLYRTGYSYSHGVNTSLAIERYMEFVENPIRLGRPRKPKRIIKETLSEAEVAVMVHAAQKIRDKAIISVLAYSGIRNGELCSLRVEDVDVGSNTLRIFQGKGKKDRICNISPECAQVIAEYLQTFPRGRGDYLFTTLDRGERYKGSALRKTLRKLARKACVMRRVYPHLFRHSLATNMLHRGANILTIKEQLGHAYIDTTMVYVNSSTERTRSEYQFYAPSYM